MLEQTSGPFEAKLGVDFGALYEQSAVARWALGVVRGRLAGWLAGSGGEMISLFRAAVPGHLPPCPPAPADALVMPFRLSIESIGPSRCPALSSNPVCSEMRAIVDAAHVPAPGARDLSIEELNVHGPFFQYWVLLKVGG